MSGTQIVDNQGLIDEPVAKEYLRLPRCTGYQMEPAIDTVRLYMSEKDRDEGC